VIPSIDKLNKLCNNSCLWLIISINLSKMLVFIKIYKKNTIKIFYLNLIIINLSNYYVNLLKKIKN
jgi:hypothetical protein